MPRTVLFVCHANTARSVMAQAMLERLLAERGVNGIKVRSAGVGRHARDGMLASLDARLALKEVGILLGEDAVRSTALRDHPEVLGAADLVLTMTAAQKELVLGFAEAAGRAVYTLRELAGEEGDIGDPAGQGEDAFRACRDEIARCLARSLDRVLVEPGRA